MGRSEDVQELFWSSEYLILRKKYPYSELFLSVFSHIQTEYGEIRSISPYSVQMGENTDQNDYQYRHFSHSVMYDQSTYCVQVISGKSI